MSNLNPAHEETDAFAPVSISIIKKKRSLPGHPDPDAEVIALSPRSLLATNRFVCEICNKGFQRDQNLQLHRRGHNLPWRLKQKASHEVKKKVYICPESSCVHHDPARALGDLTGIKKHFSRKHGEKKWKCDKCSKRYAVQSDWKAHQKTCGTREYRCDCGTLFSRRDSFITHRAFCDAMAEENAKVSGHRQGESQQSAASLDNNAPFGGDLSAAMDAPSSPISQLTGDALTSSDISKPILAKRASDFALPEGGIASLSSKWVQGGIGANGAALSKGPGLSLCLGMDPGPGPPGALQMMGNQIPSGSGPPFIMPSSKVLNNLGFSRMMPGSESHDTGMHVPSSTSAMGMLASMFSSSGNGYSRHDASNGMAGVSGYAGLMNHHDRPTMPSFVMPHSGLPTSISSMMNEFGNANGPSKASLHHTASAPMSATALLQKAAQMGATASNPSVFQKFGMGVGESSSSKDAGGMQRQPSWAGVSSIISSSAPAYSKMRQAGDLRIGSSDRGAGGSAFPSVSGHGSMQEFMNSMSGGAGLCGGAALHGMPSPGGTYSNGNNFLRHDMLRDKEQSNALNGRPSFGAGAAPPPQPGRGGGQRREHEGGTPMLDFLGVGGPSGMVVAAGASAGIGQILSQKDLASITSLNAGIKMDKSLSYQSDNKGAARQLYPS